MYESYYGHVNGVFFIHPQESLKFDSQLSKK